MEFELQPTPVVKNPLSFTTGRKIFMYTTSALLPPFGLGWAFKYLKNQNPEGKRVGWVIIAITVVSLIINLAVFTKLFSSFSNQLTDPNIQLYKDLGY
ncbi:hypothetical protein L6255_02730 [Candidatus Parcubacteria bacterium]|nr:hypothetical protein [Patescibacteria group bacterium]MBU4381380.1 hypothetical protein [Patescibacteria group bacterium]MCG2689330.1 hypothetical protein [Candidatus Parcubacteria bacterium]